jgi:hypothetical protein
MSTIAVAMAVVELRKPMDAVTKEYVGIGSGFIRSPELMFLDDEREPARSVPAEAMHRTN